jgi:2-dehydro-3-deoxygalactonokinase
MAGPALIACDWGTTNLRAWALDAGGQIVSRRNFPGLGVAQLAAGEAPGRFHAEVKPALNADGTPAILCGMVGSNLGWTTARYADLPIDLSDLAARLVTVDDPGGQVRIVPGVRATGFSGQGDVMRGEETQLFGWLAGHPERSRGRQLVCHPGTHTKWMMVEEGRLTAFVTAMTGELFAVLNRHSLLQSDTPPDDQKAFDDGVRAAGEGEALAARLFTARARVVGQGAPAESTSSYLSGLLVGADVAATPRLLGILAGEPVVLLGDARLCGLYARALEIRGSRSETFDGETAAVAGLFALHRMGTPA